MNKKLITVSIATSVVLVLGACSSVPSQNPGKKIVDASQGHRPDWIDTPIESKNGKHWFVGTSTNASDETLARDEAKAYAEAEVAESIRSDIHKYLNSARSDDSANADDYNHDTEHAIEDGVLTQSRAVMTGFHVKKYYWVEYTLNVKPHLFRDEYVLAWMTNADYNETINLTFEKERKVIHDEKARHILDFMKKHYLNSDGNEPASKN